MSYDNVEEGKTHPQLSPPPRDEVIAAAPASQNTQVTNMLVTNVAQQSARTGVENAGGVQDTMTPNAC